MACLRARPQVTNNDRQNIDWITLKVCIFLLVWSILENYKLFENQKNDFRSMLTFSFIYRFEASVFSRLIYEDTCWKEELINPLDASKNFL